MTTYARRAGVHLLGTDASGVDVWRLRSRVAGVTIDERFRGSKTKARARLEDLRALARSGQLANAGPDTVATFVDSYVAHRVTIGKLRAGQPADTYRRYVRNHVTPIIGSMRVSDVRSADVQRVIDAALAKGLAPSTVRQIRSILHGAFKHGLRMRLIAINPVDAVDLPQVKRRELRVPSAADVAAILQATSPEYRTAFVIAASTGLRRGEVAALRWEDLDLDDALPYLTVRATLQRVDGELRLMPPKSERGTRDVLLPPSLVPVLRRHRKEQSERRLLLGPAWNETAHVMDRGDGRPVDPDTLTRAFVQARDAANLPAVRLHDLRHGYATMMDAAGVDIAVISRALGHATTGFTESVYVHPDRKKAAPLAAASEAALGAVLGQL